MGARFYWHGNLNTARRNVLINIGLLDGCKGGHVIPELSMGWVNPWFGSGWFGSICTDV